MSKLKQTFSTRHHDSTTKQKLKTDLPRMQARQVHFPLSHVILHAIAQFFKCRPQLLRLFLSRWDWWKYSAFWRPIRGGHLPFLATTQANFATGVSLSLNSFATKNLNLRHQNFWSPPPQSIPRCAKWNTKYESIRFKFLDRIFTLQLYSCTSFDLRGLEKGIKSMNVFWFPGLFGRSISQGAWKRVPVTGPHFPKFHKEDIVSLASVTSGDYVTNLLMLILSQTLTLILTLHQFLI